MAANAELPAGKRRGKRKGKRGSYWRKRKNSIYLFAAQQICLRQCGEPKSVIDVGSNATPTLEWHRGTATRLVSVDLRRPYAAEGVESVTGDFLQYEPEKTFDLVTCFQVLEHIPDPVPFAQKLIQIGQVAVVSVPYKWKKGRCRYHVHDPVDERKMQNWFGRAPDFAYVARELNSVGRLIHVYRK